VRQAGYGSTPSAGIVVEPFIYQNGAFVDLNTLIPAGSGWQLADATAINDDGQILVDATSTANGGSHAFLLTPAG
jgi:probable HAF family extracellular repeat protein